MSLKSTDSFSRRVRGNYNQNTMDKAIKIPAGIYRGIVVDTQDPRKQGRIKVQVSAFHGTMPVGVEGTALNDPDEYLGAMWCRIALPWGGVTTPTESGGGQGSNVYGMYGQPPTVNNEVLVAFGADTTSGVVIGVLPEDQRLGDLPGNGITKETSTGEVTLGQATAKTATSLNDLPSESPQAERLREQGLDKDRLRGQNFSSPARDPSPRVMGMTSPSGHSIIMDDGVLEDGSNLRMQMRTAAGAQILMDDTNGFIYIVNSNGSSWIEMNRNGDIDIYCGQSLNIATPGVMNFHAGSDINFQANGNINMKALGTMALEATAGPFGIFSGSNLNLQADGNGNMLVAGNYRETAARIDMNGAAAAAANRATGNQLAGNTNVTESIAGRVPEAEPWAGHLDVSVLDSSSASGAASISESQTYYYGSPANPVGINNQTGEFDLQEYPPAQTGQFLRWAPGKDQRVDSRVIDLGDEVCRRFGRPATIISGYRSPSYNSSVGGARRSQHMLGKAIDVVFDGGALTNDEKNRVIAIASAVGFVGIGIYNSSFHFDLRDGARASWGPNYSNSGVPAFARATMDRHLSGGFA